MLLAELEQEACDVYPDVMMKRSNFVRLPAYLTVAQTHIRITSVGVSPELPLAFLTSEYEGSGPEYIYSPYLQIRRDHTDE